MLSALHFNLKMPRNRFLAAVFALSLIVPLSKYFTSESLHVLERPKLYVYHGTRGPWVGEPLPDGSWSHESDKNSYLFQEGEGIVWSSWTDAIEGTSVSKEFTLMCNKRAIVTADIHIYDTERRTGWREYGLRVPIGAPSGECSVERLGRFVGPDGSVEVKTFPSISVRIGLRP